MSILLTSKKSEKKGTILMSILGVDIIIVLLFFSDFSLLYCLDPSTQPKEPESILATCAANCHNIDHFLCLDIICSHFISIKRGKLEFFFKIQ